MELLQENYVFFLLGYWYSYRIDYGDIGDESDLDFFPVFIQSSQRSFKRTNGNSICFSVWLPADTVHPTQVLVLKQQIEHKQSHYFHHFHGKTCLSFVGNLLRERKMI